MYFQKKSGNSEGEGGSRLWNSDGMGGGVNAFWNFRRRGGVKTWKLSVVGYGYFLELPNNCFIMIKKPTKYREFFPTLFVKATNFRLVFNFFSML